MNRINRAVFRGPRPGLPVLSMALLGLAATAVPGRAATPVTSCGFAIHVPGNYELVTDLNCPGNGIGIDVSGVTLKLNGHIMTGANTGLGIAIIPPTPTSRVDHVTIEGPGLVQRFAAGLYIIHADYSQVGLITVSRSTGNGVFATDCNYLTVGSNVFVSSHADGIVYSGLNGVLKYNDVSGNASGMLILPEAINTTVNNNVSNGNLGQGIEIGGKNARVFANVTNGNGGGGLNVFAGATGNQIFNNSNSSGNNDFDLRDDNPGCGSNLWNNNVFYTRSASCIR